MVYIDDRIDALDWQACLPDLPISRQEKCLRYLNDGPRRQCVAVWLLLRDSLRRQYGLDKVPEIAYMPDGKPYFPDRSDIHFSLSHCKVAVACSLHDHSVGIDIERVHAYKDSLAAYVLNENELKSVRESINPALAFTKLWTMKESLLKLTGEGLTRNLKDVLNQCDASFQTTVNLEKGYVCTEASFLTQ